MNEALAREPCLACGSPAEPHYSFLKLVFAGPESRMSLASKGLSLT
jgi:hypothetical protein